MTGQPNERSSVVMCLQNQNSELKNTNEGNVNRQINTKFSDLNVAEKKSNFFFAL